jgi:CTP-dependent riboflavin kinase
MTGWDESAVQTLASEPQQRGTAIDDYSLILILTYTAGAHKLNAEAEVSGAELQRELELDAATVRECVTELARQGLVECDLMLTNLWLRITDKGLMLVARGFSG